MTTVQSADFSKLVSGKGYVVIGGQIIFEKDGKYYLTTIEEDRDDFTIADYQTLPEGAPFELLNGKLHYIPSPFRKHQLVAMNLSAAIHYFVKRHKLGQVLPAPMDVHFDKRNIVQPDLIFVSNERKEILEQYIKGAPDFLVEILSFGTKTKDLGEKRELYGREGVLEYWVIDPNAETITVFLNNQNELIRQKIYNSEEVITAHTIRNFSMSVKTIFEE